MSERGYGSGSPIDWVDPPDAYVEDVFDAGYGSPFEWVDAPDAPAWDPFEAGETGYGSPYSVFLAEPDVQIVRDDGGQVLRLVSGWPIRGPYQVALIGADGAAYACYGLTPGAGEDWQDGYADANVLAIATPRCPVGLYDLRIRWFEGGQQETLLTGPEGYLIDVRFRPWLSTTHALRAKLPPRAFNTGPRHMDTIRVYGG